MTTSDPAASAASSVPRRRRWLLPAVVVAVVLIALIAALFATGVLSLGPASTSAATYETFSQAESTAQSGSGSVPGGPWYAAFGAAVSIPTAVLEPTTNLSSVIAMSNCNVSWVHGEPQNIAVPVTPSSAGVGAAAYWTFGLKNITNGLLLEVVSDGVASALLTVTGGTCEEAVMLLSTFPTGVVDSPAIIQAANQAGGSAFLAAHANSTQVWGAYGGATYLGFGTSPTWFVEYTTCTVPTSVGEVGAVFNATLGGTSGEVTMTHSGTVNCVLTAPTGLTLTTHAPSPSFAARKAI
jgi:hypothetical protein